MRHTLNFARLSGACAGMAGAAILTMVGMTLSGPTPKAAASSPVVTPVQDGFATIKGRLVWGDAEAPKPVLEFKKGDQAVKDTAICAPADMYKSDLVVDPKTKGVKNAIAYIVSPKGTNPEAAKALVAKAAKVEIDQKNCEFLPRNTAAHKDQAIVFKSSDPVGHNVRFAGFSNPAQNVALPPNGSLEVKLVAEKRAIPLMCDIHPWMKGNLMVFDHPFFAVTAADGSFEIKGVPVGAQNIIIWHEKVGYVTAGAAKGKAISLKSGATLDLGDVTLDPAKVKK